MADFTNSQVGCAMLPSMKWPCHSVCTAYFPGGYAYKLPFDELSCLSDVFGVTERTDGCTGFKTYWPHAGKYMTRILSADLLAIIFWAIVERKIVARYNCASIQENIPYVLQDLPGGYRFLSDTGMSEGLAFSLWEGPPRRFAWSELNDAIRRLYDEYRTAATRSDGGFGMVYPDCPSDDDCLPADCGWKSLAGAMAEALGASDGCSEFGVWRDITMRHLCRDADGTAVKTFACMFGRDTSRPIARFTKNNLNYRPALRRAFAALDCVNGESGEGLINFEGLFDKYFSSADVACTCLLPRDEDYLLCWSRPFGKNWLRFRGAMATNSPCGADEPFSASAYMRHGKNAYLTTLALAILASFQKHQVTNQNMTLRGIVHNRCYASYDLDVCWCNADCKWKVVYTHGGYGCSFVPDCKMAYMCYKVSGQTFSFETVHRAWDKLCTWYYDEASHSSVFMANCFTLDRGGNLYYYRASDGCGGEIDVPVYWAQKLCYGLSKTSLSFGFRRTYPKTLFGSAAPYICIEGGCPGYPGFVNGKKGYVLNNYQFVRRDFCRGQPMQSDSLSTSYRLLEAGSQGGCLITLAKRGMAPMLEDRADCGGAGKMPGIIGGILARDHRLFAFSSGDTFNDFMCNWGACFHGFSSDTIKDLMCTFCKLHCGPDDPSAWLYRFDRLRYASGEYIEGSCYTGWLGGMRKSGGGYEETKLYDDGTGPESSAKYSDGYYCTGGCGATSMMFRPTEGSAGGGTEWGEVEVRAQMQFGGFFQTVTWNFDTMRKKRQAQ